MPNRKDLLHERISRRGLVKGFLSAAIMGVLFPSHNSLGNDKGFLEGRPKIVGTTFSQKQCDYLELDYQEVFEELCSLKPSAIRLCAYWDEFENNPERINYLVQKASENNIPVILVTGPKVPRYKEFHLPDRIIQEYGHPEMGNFVQNEGLIKEVLAHEKVVLESFKGYPNIFAHQINNEPLNRMSLTYDEAIEHKLLEQEVVQARKIVPDKKIMLTNAIYLWPRGGGEDEVLLNQTLSLADIIGINVYSRVPNGVGGYFEPNSEFWDKLEDWKERIISKGKGVWIAECQAEPWEDGSPVHIRQRVYPSFDPQRALQLLHKLNYLDFQNVLLWGFEHWYYHKKRGHMEWAEVLEPILRTA